MIVLRLKFHGVRVAGPNLRVAVQKQAFVVSDPVEHLPGEKDSLEPPKREVGLRAEECGGSHCFEISQNKQVLLWQQIPKKVSAHSPTLRETSVFCAQNLPLEMSYCSGQNQGSRTSTLGSTQVPTAD